jgi:hypothetical protein
MDRQRALGLVANQVGCGMQPSPSQCSPSCALRSPAQSMAMARRNSGALAR